MTARDTEPRECCVCAERERPGESFDAHEMACIRADWARSAAREKAIAGQADREAA